MEKNYEKYNVCSAAVGSLTAAQKAQKVLSSAAIPSRLVKSETASSRRGCVWGVSFSCNQRQNVTSVFNGAGVKVRSWEERGEAHDIL